MNEGVVIRIPIWYQEEVSTLIDKSSTLERFHKRLTAFFRPLQKPYVKRTRHVFVDKESRPVMTYPFFTNVARFCIRKYLMVTCAF